MTRPYTVPASGITPDQKAFRPYVWRGKPDLIEVNARLMAERAGRRERAADPAFSFPQPLPGPPKKGGATSDEAQRKRRQAAKDERNDHA